MMKIEINRQIQVEEIIKKFGEERQVQMRDILKKKFFKDVCIQ